MRVLIVVPWAVDPWESKCYPLRVILAREFLLSVAEMLQKPPITSPETRRLNAKSRVGTIIQGILGSRHTELYALVFAALSILVFYGSSNDGQASFFGSRVQGYIEDKVAALGFVQKPSHAQLADMNSVYGGLGSGIGADSSPAPSSAVVTIDESALLALTPPDDEYLERISGHRAGVVEYIVQDGDLLSFIASDYGVSQASIMWANGLKNANNLSAGQVLRIPPVSGVVHKVKSGDTAITLAKKYTADAERIIAYNRLPKDGSLRSGDEIIIPDGTLFQSSSIVSAAKKVVASTASQFSHLPDLGDYFMKPTTGIITRGGAIHGRNGIDIANLYGTPIYAAADGIVVIADADGYNGGYGKFVKITHPNGTETLYGHTSKILVSVGQTVHKGDKIALMGSTGNSTGNHLHFEVHGAKNPLAK